MANVPYKYTSEAQEERNWRKKKSKNPNNNFSVCKGDKKKFYENYDSIQWIRK